MYRLRLSMPRFLLLALLLVGQLGGFAHALSHFDSAASSDAVADSKFCPECLSQSQFASALPTPPFAFIPLQLDPTPAPATWLELHVQCTGAAAYLQRAPPLDLSF